MEFRCGLNRTFNVNAYRVLMSEWNVLLNFQEHYKLSQPCSIMWWNTIRLHLYSLILPGSFFFFSLLSLSLSRGRIILLTRLIFLFQLSIGVTLAHVLCIY